MRLSVWKIGPGAAAEDCQHLHHLLEELAQSGRPDELAAVHHQHVPVRFQLDRLARKTQDVRPGGGSLEAPRRVGLLPLKHKGSRELGVLAEVDVLSAEVLPDRVDDPDLAAQEAVRQPNLPALEDADGLRVGRPVLSRAGHVRVVGQPHVEPRARTREYVARLP